MSRAKFYGAIVCLSMLLACEAPDTATTGEMESERMAGDTIADRASVEERSRQMIEMVNSGNLEDMEDFYTEDAIEMPMYAEMHRGRDAIMQASRESTDEMEGLETSIVSVEVDGDHGYETGTYSIRVRPQGMEDWMDDQGKYLTVWERGEDGVWRVDRFIFNSSGPPPGMAGGPEGQPQ